MMTPKEVQEHGFSRSRKGYDMAEVDEFLDTLTEDYTALYTNYGKLSSSYAKLRKKAQAMASALEQAQQKGRSAPAPAPAKKPAPAAPAAPSAAVASQAAVDEILRTARKDAEAIRAGAERERQEIIAQATDYAEENAERLRAEVAAEEQRLAALKKTTAAYVSQARLLIARQSALLDSTPLQDENYTPGEGVSAPAEAEEAVPAPAAEPEEAGAAAAEEPTLRVDENSSMVEEISRNILNLRFDEEEEDASEDTRRVGSLSSSDLEDLSELDDSGSLFDAISNVGEFDEE